MASGQGPLLPPASHSLPLSLPHGTVMSLKRTVDGMEQHGTVLSEASSCGRDSSFRGAIRSKHFNALAAQIKSCVILKMLRIIDMQLTWRSAEPIQVG